MMSMVVPLLTAPGPAARSGALPCRFTVFRSDRAACAERAQMPELPPCERVAGSQEPALRFCPPGPRTLDKLPLKLFPVSKIYEICWSFSGRAGRSFAKAILIPRLRGRNRRQGPAGSLRPEPSRTGLVLPLLRRERSGVGGESVARKLELEPLAKEDAQRAVALASPASRLRKSSPQQNKRPFELCLAPPILPTEALSSPARPATHRLAAQRPRDQAALDPALRERPRDPLAAPSVERSPILREQARIPRVVEEAEPNQPRYRALRRAALDPAPHKQLQDLRHRPLAARELGESERERPLLLFGAAHPTQLGRQARPPARRPPSQAPPRAARSA